MFQHYVDLRYSENGAIMAGGSPILAQHALMAVHRCNLAISKRVKGDTVPEHEIAYPQMRHQDDDRRRRLGDEVFLAIAFPLLDQEGRSGTGDGRTPGSRTAEPPLSEITGPSSDTTNHDSSNSARIGMARTSAVRTGTLLTLVRVFGSEQHLSDFIASEDVQRMLTTDMIRRPRIREVPSEHGRCVFKRERRSDKNTLSYVLRSENRYVQRDNQRQQSDPTLPPRDNYAILTDRLRKLEKAGRTRTPCFISMESKSSGLRFSLNIEVSTQVTEGAPLFNSYGLASSSASWVPAF